MPDLFKGDPVPTDAFDPGATFDLPAWLAKHPIDEVDERIRAVISALKAEGVTKFAALGYCYGGRTCFDLAFTNDIQVVAVAHPSLLKIPDDLEVCVLSDPLMCTVVDRSLPYRNTSRPRRRPS